MNKIDDLLNKITMYRLILYYLYGLLGLGIVFSSFNLLAFSLINLIGTSLFIILICWVFNRIFSLVFEVPTNQESYLITALILCLIISPAKDLSDLPFIIWASIWSIAGKFILAINKKHIFNPAALGVALPAFFMSGSASWWVGTQLMFPFTLLGLLIVRKIHRFDLVFYFFTSAALVIFTHSALNGSDLLITFKKVLFDSPILFFAFVMLTEPLTTPPTTSLQSLYGSVVGLIFAPFVHVGSIYSTPEIALLIGNVFSYLISPKYKLLLTLKQKISLSPDIYDFVFKSDIKIKFNPGQYLEWTINDPGDSRGNRRYFTIASSPTEEDLKIGVKLPQNASKFKQALLNMKGGESLLAGSLSGNFTLKKDPNEKYVFIAGGIGITPFRSIIKYLVDTNQKRDIVLFYSVVNDQSLVYADLFKEAEKIGVKFFPIITEKDGFLTAEIIKNKTPDLTERTFYISGPQAMVVTFEKTLAEIGIKSSKIVVDYFPGF